MSRPTACAMALVVSATLASAQEAPPQKPSQERLPKIVLNAGEEPQTMTWTQPASLSYTGNSGAPDSWAIDAAGKYQWLPFKMSSHLMFGRVVVQKNTQVKKEIENYVAEYGLLLDLSAGGGETAEGIWSLPTKVSLAWADKTIFPDAKAVCTASPLPADCVEQEERSLRASASTQFFYPSWERTYATKDGTHTELVHRAWTYSFLPVLGVFYDELLDAKTAPNGVKPDGHVAGAKAVISLAGSPKFTNYRMVLSTTFQEVYAFDRSSGREATFQRESWLVAASLDYELGKRSFFDEDHGWVPTVGVTYKRGDDPLSATLDQDSVMVAFKMTYRAGKKAE